VYAGVTAGAKPVWNRPRDRLQAFFSFPLNDLTEPIDRPAVADLAALAKLRLTPVQIEHAQVRMERLLAAFRVLEEVPTDAVEPSPYPLPLAHRMRADAPEPPLTQHEVLANAPDRRTGAFRVPRMIEG
jgi:aspartyl-tRNA(Asn)/glutamyl-tRNA(Gln) amidotransferase subunit C